MWFAKVNGDPVTILRPTTLPSLQPTPTASPKHPLSMEVGGGESQAAKRSDRQRVTIREPIVLKLASEA